MVIFCFQNPQDLQSLHMANKCLMYIHTSILKNSLPTYSSMMRSITIWLINCLTVIGDKQVSQVHEQLTKKEFRWSRTVSSSWGTVKDCWLQNSSRSFADCNHCVNSFDSLWYLGKCFKKIETVIATSCLQLSSPSSMCLRKILNAKFEILFLSNFRKT